jgi:hypothetical protein
VAHRRLAPLAILSLLVLAGCPLDSDFPLSDPASAAIDGELVGGWLAKDPESGESRRFTFLPFDEHELLGASQGEAADSVDAFRAFTTLIEGERFLNVRELGKGSSGWYILRYRIEGGKLSMSLVDDALFEGRSFSGPAELSAFLGRNLSNPRLYASGAGEAGRDFVWDRAPG